MRPLLRRQLSLFVGWLADRRVPRFLRKTLYKGFARITGADPSQAQLPLDGYTSLGAFFVRRLKDGAREIDERPDRLVSPADGTLQAFDPIENDTILQAKGQTYRVSELLGDEEDAARLAGGLAWTIYLGPKDYHRVHSPWSATLRNVRWLGGDRRSVAPNVLARTERVLATNERAVLELDTENGPCFLVMVGALNVGRIRVVGVAPNAPAPTPPRAFERGAELARFEMGSTVVLLLPRDAFAPEPLALGSALRQGQALARQTSNGQAASERAALQARS